MSPRQRFRVALQSHIQRHKLQVCSIIRIASRNNDPIESEVNCSLRATSCVDDSDCSSQCIPRSDGKYNCVEGICMYDGVKPIDCNLDHDGLLVSTFDPATRMLMYSCECQTPDVWGGGDCNEPNPFFCQHGRIVKLTDFEWKCLCDEPKKLVRLHKNQNESRQRAHYTCMTEPLIEQLRLTDAYFGTTE